MITMTNSHIKKLIFVVLLQFIIINAQRDFQIPKVGEKLMLQSVEGVSFLADPPGDEFTLKVTPKISYFSTKVDISFCIGFNLHPKVTYHIEVKSKEVNIYKKLENNELTLDISRPCISFKSITFILGANTNLEVELLNSKFREVRIDPKTLPSLPPIVHESSYRLVSSLSEINNFRSEFLRISNEQRRTHMANDLKVDPLMEQYAQYYVEWLAKYRKCTTDRSGGSFSPKVIYSGGENEMKKGEEIFGKDYWNWIIKAYDRFGENVYLEVLKDQKSCTAERITSIYYKDITQYAEANPNYLPEYSSKGEGSRFTQTVWKGTKYIGVGYAKCYNEKTKETICYTISSYYPPGNNFKEYSSNVYLPDNLEEILDKL